MMALYDGLIAWLLRIVSTVDFWRIMLYFARARAFRSLFARIWLSVGARTIAAPPVSRQRPAMVAALLGGHIRATLTPCHAV